MIPVAEVECLLQPQSRDHRRRVPLVAEDGFSQAEIEGILFVVAGPDEVARVALSQQFGDCAAAKIGPSSRCGVMSASTFPLCGVPAAVFSTTIGFLSEEPICALIRALAKNPGVS